MQKNVRLRHGSVALALIFAAVIILILLPAGVFGIKRLYYWCLIMRSEQYLSEILPAASAGLSPTDLADGQGKFMTTTTRSLLTNRFNNHLPPALQDRLKLIRIVFSTRRLTPDPNHWMGPDQPLSQPIIQCQAELTLDPGETVILTHALEFFLN